MKWRAFSLGLFYHKAIMKVVLFKSNQKDATTIEL